MIEVGYRLPEPPKLYLDYDKISEKFKQMNQELDEEISAAAEEREKKFDETRQAAIETAENTAEMKQDLKIVIHNQNNYIKMLEYQNQLLKNMFVSGEDGVVVQKEIMKILQEQGETDSTFKDKGLDAGIQAVFLGIQIWLKSRGIDF